MAFELTDIPRASPLLLARWASALTTNTPEYSIEFQKLTSVTDFWDAYERHRSELVSVEFSLRVPNPIGMREETAAWLRTVRDTERADTVNIKFSAPAGTLNLNTDRVRDTVDYIVGGGGEAKLKKKGMQKVFDTKDQAPRTISVETQDDSLDGRRTLFGSLLNLMNIND